MDEFEIGKCYQVKEIDQLYPQFDREGNELNEEVSIKGKLYRFKVISKPVSHPDFIEVYNLDLRKKHLFFSALAETVTVINASA